MPTISKRGSEVPMSPFRKLVPYADKAKAAGKKVYHLNIGQPDILTPPAAMQQLKETDLPILAYTPAIGHLSYRTKLVDYLKRFDVAIDVASILVTSGASEGLLFAMLACFDAGDEIIVPEPFYANYNGFAQMGDVHIRPITSYIEDGFALPAVADFEQRITPKTRGILITNPNNPTGCLYTEESLRALAELVKKHDLFLIVDEVYREFCYDGGVFFSALNLPDIEDHVIVVDSISKRYSACGARIGAVITRNDTIIESITKYAKLRLSPPGLAQVLAEATLDSHDAYIPEVQEEYLKRRDVVFERLSKMPKVVSYRPGGAFYCFARFPISDGDHFCKWLLEEFDYEGQTVMLSPGSGFYATPGLGKDEVRIAYVINSDDLNRAMDCLERALEEYTTKVENQVSVVE